MCLHMRCDATPETLTDTGRHIMHGEFQSLSRSTRSTRAFEGQATQDATIMRAAAASMKFNELV